MIKFLHLFVPLVEVIVVVSSHVLSTHLLSYPHQVEGGMEHWAEVELQQQAVSKKTDKLINTELN